MTKIKYLDSKRLEQESAYKVHTFTEGGTFTVTGSGDVEYLVVAGGGGGGATTGGGGGAGGFRTNVKSTTSGGGGSAEATYGVTAQSYSITVGTGGAGSYTGVDGVAGTNSSIVPTSGTSIISTGGGNGGRGNIGGNGGSGGGAGDHGGGGGTGVSGQGYAGGNGIVGSPYVGGGGGGAGGIGQTASTGVAGNGGAGLSSSITGTSICYAGGGGAGGGVSGTFGTATCGGTAGVSGATEAAVDATANTGGGGGGANGGTAGLAGGDGGSGIVVIRYLSSSSIVATGGTVTVTDGLVAQLKFNDDVTDTYGNNGTVTGTETYVAGKIDKAFSFNGSTEVVLSNESNFDFDISSPFSISAWCKTNGGGTEDIIVSKYQTGASYGWNLKIDGSGLPRFTIYAGGSVYSIVGSSTVNDDNWHHIVGTFDGTSNLSGMKIITDEAIVTGGSSAMSSNSLNSYPVRIGAQGASINDPFTGLIDDVRIYDRELTQGEVNIIYNGGTGTESESPSSVQDNSILVEKYTGKRFWFSNNNWNSRFRGIFAGGADVNGATSTMEYISIASPSNASAFGNLSQPLNNFASVHSDVRGVFCGGISSANTDAMEYITIATLGNTSPFGTLLASTRNINGVSSDVTGIIGGGSVNTTQYITIATLGNGLNFGNLSSVKKQMGGVSSDVRGIFAGGSITSVGDTNEMDYFTIATASTAGDFGDLSVARKTLSGINSDVRGVFCGGSYLTICDYVTIATTGNATTFGNLSQSSYGGYGVSSDVRGVVTLGWSVGAESSKLDYITIPTLGNSNNFGDLSVAKIYESGVSGQ